MYMSQLVQHLPRMQKIAGSSPARGSSSFSLEKKELSSGVVACICLVSITDYSCNFSAWMEVPWWFNYPGLLLNAEVEYPCLSGERRHLPCINFKDSARPAELPRWLSWYSICLERRRSRVRVPPEAALLFLWKKRSCLRVSLLAFALSL